MEDWSKDFWQAVESIAEQVENFWVEQAEAFVEAADAWVKFSEEVAEQVEQMIVTEVDPWMEELAEPLLSALLGLESRVEEAAEPVMHTVEPILNQHPACVGCHHYHGQFYGEAMLVCGMHPYGWEGEQCPDWESTWERDRGDRL